MTLQRTNEEPSAVRVIDRPSDQDPAGESAGSGVLGTLRVSHPELLAAWAGVTGLLVQVIGYALGWHGLDNAVPIALWYVGYVVLITPFVLVLLIPGRTGRQRLGASLVYSMLIYASWLLSNPVLSTRYDENLHVTTLVDLVEYGSFFTPNSTLPVSPHFPGLELAAAAVHWLTGLPLFPCQVLVVLASKLLFVCALFLMTSRICRSSLAGATAVMLYSGSQQYYFFNSQFAYQTLAIAMLVSALYLLVRAFDSPLERPWRELAAAQACLAALALTHHLTSWLALGVLWCLTLLFKVGHDQRRFRLTLVTAELATIVVAAWTAVIAPLLIGYVKIIFGYAGAQLLLAIDGSGGRSVGGAADGSSAPTWEIATMAASILLWLLLLVPAGWTAWWRGSIGRTRARYLPLLIVMLYPLLQAGRYSASAGEVADRTSTFVAMAMCLIVAAWLAPRLARYGSIVVVPAALILIVGGTILGGGPDWARVPGPLLAGAEQRSIDGQSVAVAQWAGTYLPADSRLAGDAAFSRLLPNYAPVVPLTEVGGYDNMTPIFAEPTIDQSVLKLIFDDKIDFIVVDTRLVGQTARAGSLYEGSTDYDGANTVTRDQVTKFEGAPGFRLILDGPVKVYDVRALRGVSATFPAPRRPHTLPGSWTPWQVLATAALMAIGLVARRRLLDPRRFRAAQFWRWAIVLPAAIGVGVVGVVAKFNPVIGTIGASILLYELWEISRSPSTVPADARSSVSGNLRPRAAIWRIRAATVAMLAVAAVLGIWSAADALLNHPALPAPLSVGGSAR